MTENDPIIRWYLTHHVVFAFVRIQNIPTLLISSKKFTNQDQVFEYLLKINASFTLRDCVHYTFAAKEHVHFRCIYLPAFIQRNFQTTPYMHPKRLFRIPNYINIHINHFNATLLLIFLEYRLVENPSNSIRFNA